MQTIHSRVLVAVMMVTVSVSLAAAGAVDDAVRAVSVSPRPLQTATERGLEVRDGRVQVVAITDGGDTAALESWLESRGARFLVAVGGRVQAFVTPDLLGELAERPEVLAVERPLYAELPGPVPPAAATRPKILVTSEGLAVMNTDAWHAAGVTGVGTKVAVIDVEFGGWEDLLGVELPPAERTTYRSFGGSQVVADQVHGTACAEIVHDIAPDAEVYLAHIRTGNDLFAALDWLAAEGVDVATMSIGWYGAGPGDGTGVFVERVNAFVAAADAAFLTSAGNDRRAHWQGATVDTNGDDWVDFSPGDDLNELSATMSAGDRVAVNIAWNDWNAPTSDYSLHLFNLDGAEPVEVAVSDRPQTGQSFQTPFEQISYTAPNGGRFGVRINRAGVVGTHDLELFSLDSDLVDRVGEGSITLPADSELVIAAAAVNYSAPHTLRSYSSAGPANGPGGALAGGEVKPDLSGYDGVTTASYGLRAFFGTSSAAPHVAGAIALVRDADSGLGAAAARAFLEGRALDLGTAGKDNDFGWGRVFLGAPPGSSCSFEISPTAASVAAGGGGGVIRVTTQDGCPWTTSSGDQWLAVAPASATGSGNAGFTAQANPDPSPRTGELMVAGHSFVVTQAGAGCAFVLSSYSKTFPSTGGDGRFSVEADTGCSWTAVADDPWISVSAGTGTGSGEVAYSVDVNPDAGQRTGTISLADQSFTVVQNGAGADVTTMVAGIAETEGASQTRWKSDLAILNPGDEPASVDMTYRHDRGTVESSLTVESREVVELVNVAASTFGSPDSSGAVELRSPAGLIVTARTYNDAAAGTFGQFLPGLTAADGLAAGEVAALSQLRSGTGFRTNIGFVDLAGTGAVARIRLHDGAGIPVGNELAETVPAGGWFQRNRVFREAQAGNCSGCYALVEVVGDGLLWAYASVVDNSSGDPTTVPMEVLDGGGNQSQRYLVAGVAETGGANQTRWKSNLALLNLSGEPATVDLLYRHDGLVVGSSLTLLHGELREFEDVAGDLFNASGSAGAVDVDADVPLVVTARTFNDAPRGTFGQFLPGLGVVAALAPGTDGVLSQLKSTEGFRTNIGFTNYSDAECTVRTSLYDELGEPTGMLFTVVPAGGWTQVNRVFETAGVGSTPLGYAVVEVLTGGCRAWAYASVVDNGSGDPTTVPVVVP